MPSLKLNNHATSQGKTVPLLSASSSAKLAAPALTDHHTSIAVAVAPSIGPTYAQPLPSSSSSNAYLQNHNNQPQTQALTQPHQSHTQSHPPPSRSPQIPPASSPPSSRHSKAPQPAITTASARQTPPATELDRPPVSPITPPLRPLKSKTPIPPPTIPTNFASLGGRAPLTHSSHPETVPSAAPPPVPLDPIDFNDNPDVIALQTTINILLRQKQQTERDIRKLRDAKDAAVQRPMEFARDLVGGRVNQGGNAQGQQQKYSQGGSTSLSDDSNVEMKEEDDEDEHEGKEENDSVVHLADNDSKPSAMKASASEKGKATAYGTRIGARGAGGSQSVPEAPPWANLPKPQDIVRCPPINWSQYAIEGEALNKLHAEQVAKPMLGTPALMAVDGTYEFTGVPNQDDGKQVDGIAAPFNPFRDRKAFKSGASKRGA
ncbi:hypothetical protein BD289DRAFT_438083 [Coniella lustricola]|uniref:Uncharacterized protein n=1 Tax=Coniella lustricola TaxID=2025994 RepID=A0A2T3A3E7_9PEZI|nr:hypothetical protein BD289DRAFT_438083 [Coniella lustricola]